MLINPKPVNRVLVSLFQDGIGSHISYKDYEDVMVFLVGVKSIQHLESFAFDFFDSKLLGNNLFDALFRL